MYIEAYQQLGLHIDTFVPQNEPGFEPNGYHKNIIKINIIMLIKFELYIYDDDDFDCSNYDPDYFDPNDSENNQ